MGIPILATMYGTDSIYSVLVLKLISSLVMIPLTTMLLTIADGKGCGTRCLCRACRERYAVH
ncbi:hypothetical protein [Pseudomonas sp. Sample_16]|uniref:hypothetical protein n=1 Tax=Pseudomonas sp. Sample_16 TaxID=2448263 RepID=UPI001F4F9F3A|nr:hypothetical protein [Pseudomonas sp. Sample_16]